MLHLSKAGSKARKNVRKGRQGAGRGKGGEGEDGHREEQKKSRETYRVASRRDAVFEVSLDAQAVCHLCFVVFVLGTLSDRFLLLASHLSTTL